LFRQAISLRVAFAASPRTEFRFEAREKLLFAAGRDVKQALLSEPDPQFVSATRQRLLNRAGAGAQEALRDVPPPRLPFWVNARRRLLETASAGPPKPAPRLPSGFRYALSAAVIVLAVAIAGAGFFLDNSPANRPSQTSAVSAELDYISEQIGNFEQLRARGEFVSSSLLDDLAERTGKLAEQYSQDGSNSELLGKLPDLIERQQTLLAEEDSLDEAVATAQQRLDEADQKVAAVASPVPTGTSGVAAVEPTSVTTVEETTEPDPTPEIPEVAIVSPSDLSAGQIVWQYDAVETSLGLRWWRVTTSTLTFVMSESWDLRSVITDEAGLAVLPSQYIFIETDVDGIVLVVNSETGDVFSIDPSANLRGEGPDGALIAPDALAALAGADADWASIYIMLDSVELVTAAATETVPASPTATGTATPTATPANSAP
jgi:hypothetical protein